MLKKKIKMESDLEPVLRRVITLENGMKILFLGMVGDIFHLQIDIKTGVDDEKGNELETAHFLEHLNAQFTSSTYPDQEETHKELEKMGITWNAFVSARRTGYFMRGLADEKIFKKASEYMIESFVDFKLDKDIYDKELQAVKQELRSYLNGYISLFSEIHLKLLFPNHPRSIGIAQRLNGLEERFEDTQKVFNFRNKFYRSQDTVVSIALPLNFPLNEIGVNDLKELQTSPDLALDKLVEMTFEKYGVEKIKKRLETVQRGSENRFRKFPFLKLPESYTKNQRVLFTRWIRTPKNGNSFLVLTLRFAELNFYNLKHRVYIDLFKSMLFQGFSSRLYKELRSESGLIYNVNVDYFFDRYDSQMNILNIQTNTEQKNTKIVVNKIITILLDIAKNGIQKWELEKYNNSTDFYYSKKELNLDPRKWIDSYASDLLWDQPIQTETHKYNITQEIDSDEYNEFIKKLILDEKRNLFITYTNSDYVKFY